jgi:hypothetical protein
MLTIVLRSKPAGAEVFMGQERKSLGVAPATLILPMSSDLVRLVAKFPDGSEVVQSLVPDREIPELIFEKVVAAKPTAKPTTRSKPVTKPKPTTKTGKPDDRDSTLDPFKR